VFKFSTFVKNGQSLRPGSVQLQPNQLLETKRGYVAVLLAPGAFLRVGTDGQIRMLSASLADTRIEVVRGEAMVEAADFVKIQTWAFRLVAQPPKSITKACTILMPPQKL